MIQDIARRLAGLNFAKPTAAWQMQRLTESGAVYEAVLAELAALTGQSEAVQRAMFQRAAGLNPLPLNLSPAMAQVLAAGLAKTQGVMRNLTMTTAAAGQESFVSAADLAYMQITSGAFDYQSALRAAVKQVADQGLTVIHYASGRHDPLDVAMRRTVLTGVSQMVGEMQMRRADEMGVDLVQTSAHVGARNHGTGPANHEGWQGRIFSRSGASREHPNFVEATGYGTGAGLGGYNCRHSFYPFFEGISENAYSQATLDDYAAQTVTYNGEEMSVYNATQQQRAMERQIRHWKRQAGALEAAGLDATAETNKVREWQAKLRSFTEQTGLKRQGFRERVYHPVSEPGRDPDMRRARQGKLFDLNSTETDLILSKPIDLSTQYQNEQLKASQTVLSGKQKIHLRHNHKSDLEWLKQNQDLVLSAITNPRYRDVQPRRGDKGALNIAGLISIVVRSFSI